ncbi:MAG: TetR family transcriptional regulator C-terminal domain-containing protein [Ectothiorhodospiraceae bacterium]|nr:TetR family transcriptional regulator C-terminal domain-containing protein [Ectothiorhodospiraceae bacterium]
MAQNTRETLLDAGLTLLLRHGYNDLGIQAVLKATGTPRGSFYHFFASKEAFALEVVDQYMVEVHQGLDAALGDTSLPPLERARHFFELSRDKYRRDGYFGCMLGGLGQELSGTNPAFARKIEECFAVIVQRLADCMQEAKEAGDLPADTDPQHMADLLLNCWEGAALRCRLRRDPAPLDEMLDFYFARAQSA